VAAPDALRERIVTTVRRVPAGAVATYGQIAAEAGAPRRARLVGHVLKKLPADSGVPWHRVINARGEVSPRSERGYEHYQRHLLEEEGVAFTAAGKVDLERYRWEP
jgi:methylated-DNA-protein-cysteine methyltransferase-like protein